MSQNKSPTTNRVCKYFQQQEKFADMETRERKTENLVIRNGINQLISYLPPKVMQCPAPAVKKRSRPGALMEVNGCMQSTHHQHHQSQRIQVFWNRSYEVPLVPEFAMDLNSHL